ncbi:HK97 gp10 family phage protein [Burkholderia thailandensis]|uniref:HK97-gp10 family putative phage morphogenesis protein n=1 Tax=Burkholderia thailandensis TaxID=57975 RepID=UPI00107EC4A8|nr:HK97-gp10 family putative phage morphogenesis protein [Burkholderia thailandensis]MCZ2897299.1 HK97 gp10 family phage protein [Burkholderia thailandensis]TGB34828.1 hypothetical protein C6946_04395 [Burkholderia thailandensis]
MVAKFGVRNPGGVTDVLNRLENVASESVLRQAAVAGARVLHQEIRMRAPVAAKGYERKGAQHEPGTLRRSIIIAYDKEQSVPGKLALYLVTWSKEAFYGYFVENGTSEAAAYPFLRPGYDAKKEEAAQAVVQVYAQKVQEAINGK